MRRARVDPAPRKRITTEEMDRQWWAWFWTPEEREMWREMNARHKVSRASVDPAPRTATRGGG